MENSSPGVLVIGGGVAGMAAARYLADQGAAVHLVEASGRLGGNAASWACMATDTCRQCGACLSLEMADKTAAHPKIETHLNTRIEAVEKTSLGFEAAIAGGKKITGDKIILASGFTPFDPSALPSLGWGSLDRVITTAQLNRHLREDTLGALLENNPAPKIAFLQCVGSRNRSLDRDFCSQVCCKISLRHADKLTHRLPEAEISLFYMDLQIIGKEARTLAEDLSGRVSLIQGVPAEIRENSDSGQLILVTEDPAQGTRKSLAFDLVVLSVGMSPPQHQGRTNALLDITPDEWGFCNGSEDTRADGVYMAGCATGPKDIPASRQDGTAVAARVWKDLKKESRPERNVAVCGEGSQAAATARALAKNGIAVHCFGLPEAQAPETARALENAKILSVDGTTGHFSIRYEMDGKALTLACDAVIAAPEPECHPNAGTPELPSAIDLSRFAKTGSEQAADHTLILLDYFGPEFKTNARLALTAAMAVRDKGKTVSIVMNKMLVHRPNGQRLYDRARKAGVRLYRYDAPDDIAITPGTTGFEVRIAEATLGGRHISLACDTLVVPATIKAAPGFEHLARLLKQPLDKEGFLQSSNVRHRLVQSPRRGLFFAGTGHDEVDETDLAAELDAIMANLEFNPAMPADPGVEVNQKKCAQCLTCLRICPHNALFLNKKNRPQINPDACFSCHLCVANCPANAIESKAFTTNTLVDKIQEKTIAVLACQRSAALAAGAGNLPDGVTLIPLPCACRVSPEVLLKLLINGASKVILATCHDGNCRSVDGTAEARRKVAGVTAMPGLDPSRAVWEPIAANETQQFERILDDAVNKKE